MIYPTKRLVATAAVPALASVLLVAFPGWVWAVVAFDTGILLIWIWDLAGVPRPSWFAARRSVMKVLSHDQWHDLELALDVRAPKALRLTVWDMVPKNFDVKGMPEVLEAGSKQRLLLEFRVRPLQRGSYSLGPVYVLAQSRGGFWARRMVLNCTSVVNVYPNLRKLAAFKLLARANREGLIGVRKVKRLGGDQEFDRMRDYIKGDEYRDIDWKVTAKRRQLTVRSYRQEENQNLIFMLDCGRMMTSSTDDLTLLDHAVNASLLLSHVALKQGDRVGLVAFASHVSSHVPARGGMGQLKHLIHASFDLFPSYEESHFDHAFMHVSGRFRKRALLVLITHVLDEVNADRITSHLTSLTRRHLPLCVSYSDPSLDQFLQQPPQAGAQFYEMAAAAQVSDWKRKVMADLKAKGVLVLETSPASLSANLINTYLQIKARHLL